MSKLLKYYFYSFLTLLIDLYSFTLKLKNLSKLQKIYKKLMF